MRLPSRFDRDAAGLQPHAQCAAIRGALDPRPGLPPACHHVRLRVAEAVAMARRDQRVRSEEHTSELQSLMRISYAVFCLKKKNKQAQNQPLTHNTDKRTSYDE